MPTGKVYFIGAGPGDPKLITVKGREVLEAAELVIYAGSLVNLELLTCAHPAARIIDSAELALPAIADEMITAARAGKIIARLHTGEPSLYGAIAEQIDILEKNKIPFEIIPGVTSAFAAAAALHIEYTLPDVTQTLILTRRAGRTNVPDKESLASLAAHRASMVVFLSIGMVSDVVQELVEGGYPETTPAAVVYRASWPDERKVAGTLATIAAQVRDAGITRQALILVGDAVGRNVQAVSKLYDAQFSHGFRSAEKKGTAVVAVTRRGWHTALRAVRALEGAELFLPMKLKNDAAEAQAQFYADIKPLLGQLFYEYEQLVLVMASGIAVRLLAPHLVNKWQDPAVVVMDESGKNVISLLSGHWGGANDLAGKLARALGGNPVITTESDIEEFPAFDLLIKALTGGRKPSDPKLLKHIQTAVLEGRDVGFYPRGLQFFPGMVSHANLHFFDSIEELYISGCAAGIIACGHCLRPVPLKENFSLVTIRDIVVGIGCHKGTTAEMIEQGVTSVLAGLGLSAASISLVCSIDKKSGEEGLREYCKSHDLKVKFYAAHEINAVTTPSPPSHYALKVMGVQGVAEPCAILGSKGGDLLTHKKKLKNMTVAVARIQLRELLEKTV